MDRRLFLKETGLIAAAATLPQISDAASLNRNKSNAGLSILQGLTTETTTQLTVDLPIDSQVVYSIVDRQTSLVPDVHSVTSVSNAKTKTRVDKIIFIGLQLGHHYRFEVRDRTTNKILDERFLSTVDLSKPNPRLGFMSCMRDGSSSSTISKIWASAEAANLDYLIFLGDNVYGDSVFSHGPDYLWSRYITTRQKLPFYRWKTLKPVIAGWDDHDFGKNNEDGNYEHKVKALETFKAFFPQEPVRGVLELGLGNSKIFRAFNQNFVFFDSRYFRGLKNTIGYNGFVGIEQIQWATDSIGNSANATWVLQGSPVFGRTDKGGGYQDTSPQELDYLIATAKTWNSPILFSAGDVHFTEISSLGKEILGYNSYEVISSCMHSTTKSKFYDNPNPQLNGYLKENFVIAEKTGGANDYSWNLTCVGVNSTMQFTRGLKVA